MIKRLYELREDNDLKQKDVAAYLNIAQRTYSGYETGTREMPIQLLKQLALFYNTSIDYILELTDETKPYPRAH
ncbi:MAG TPA: helix-turn-helix transcriptional regulator [Candidatus Ornithomonoglobus intestinigallinarum]|uniref:Helix-turn-helix transcriptional regulator n=1 Tax=Candidatus Ornithomonoglobus intestinigallinarum TaxID=2840894 RepID=A0A9D1H3J0_9FIRM|nr:helix-turn-helix transcriptional regulator [Candidatus Ornithomonoglobus intestinigallinarum]